MMTEGNLKGTYRILPSIRQDAPGLLRRSRMQLHGSRRSIYARYSGYHVGHPSPRIGG